MPRCGRIADEDFDHEQTSRTFFLIAAPSHALDKENSRRGAEDAESYAPFVNYAPKKQSPQICDG